MSQNKRSNLTSLDLWYHKRNKALTRVVAIYEKGEAAGEDELNRALDALALAHTAATFEWGSGPIKW